MYSVQLSYPTPEDSECILYISPTPPPRIQYVLCIKQGRRGGRSGVRRCIRIDVLSSLPSVFPFSPQSSSRYSQEHKKQRHFFKKKENWQEKEYKKNEKTPNLSFGCELPEKFTRRALILDANSGCGGRPGPPREYLGL